MLMVVFCGASLLRAKSMPTAAKPTACKAFAKRAEPQKTSSTCTWGSALAGAREGAECDECCPGCREALNCCALMLLLACQNLLRKAQTRGSVCLPPFVTCSSIRSKSDSSESDIVGESGEELRSIAALSRCLFGEGDCELGEITIIAWSLPCAGSVRTSVWKISAAANSGRARVSAAKCKSG